MSTIKVDSIKSADGNTDLLTLSNGAVSGVNLGRRNLIINGAMQVAQRGTSFTGVGNGDYTLDRFKIFASGGGVFNVEQSTDAPDDFQYSYKVTVSTADSSISATDYYILNHRIEGLDTAQLNFGTSSAKTVTLSFYVKSSIAGTFSGSINNSAENRNYPYTYTINSANTWERKTVTISGSTDGTWLTNNSIGLHLWWDFGTGTTYTGTAGAWNTNTSNYGVTGQTQLVGTSSATWQITGVQLEVGSVATPFEHRSYGEELALCQRYYSKTFNDSQTPANNAAANGQCLILGFAISSNYARSHLYYPVTMRATPTITFYSSNVTGSATNYWGIYNGSWYQGNANTIDLVGDKSLHFQIGIGSAVLSTKDCVLTSGFITADAEL